MKVIFKTMWKQTIFKPEDFDGSGQYLIREPIDKERTSFISDSGYLSTIMLKVGYSHATRRNMAANSNYCLIDMSDGLIREGYFTNTETSDCDKWIWNPFAGTTSYEAKTRLCEYLNNNPRKETFRFATNEEVVRVVMCQRGYRTKN